MFPPPGTALAKSTGPGVELTATHTGPADFRPKCIQAGENMPSYGKNLTPAERLLSWHLQTLHPAGQAPARDASRALAFGGSGQNSPQSVPQVGRHPQFHPHRTMVRFRLSYYSVFLAHRSICEVGRVSASTIPSVISPWQLAAFKMKWDVCSVDCLGFTAASVSP